jgi:REP element-mobilizing transposase RayT
MVSGLAAIRTAGVPPASCHAALADWTADNRTAGVSPALTRPQIAWRSRGYLPHCDAPHLVQHLIFRLADSLPVSIRADIVKRPPQERVRAVDAALDRGFGRRDLTGPAVADLVQQSLLAFDSERYRLIAWVIMPNHVHALLQVGTGCSLDRITHSWKSYTAKQANNLLDRTGAFWAPEYFDRFMRNEEHLARTAVYIEANPVNAGLCDSVSDWRYSSAWHGWAGGTPAVRNMMA